MEEFEVYRNENTQKESYRASGSAHDDLVMSLCGCFLIRNSQVQECVPRKRVENKFSDFKEDPFQAIREQKRKNVIKKKEFIRW